MPKYLKKPEPVECMEHDDITFTTTVSGKPEPVIEWYRGDAKLEPSEKFVYEKDGNVHTLHIKGVKKDEEGMVTVKAINELGDMSASARLRVTGRLNSKYFRWMSNEEIITIKTQICE